MTEAEKHDEHMKQFFRDPASQKEYDPYKKFGTINTEAPLIYDNITTAYPVNLPPDYYQKHV